MAENTGNNAANSSANATGNANAAGNAAKNAAANKSSLFREKNLERLESPEKLNDYLRVTSPGVWMVLRVGDIVYPISLSEPLETDGFVTGDIVTEILSPLSLLFK